MKAFFSQDPAFLNFGCPTFIKGASFSVEKRLSKFEINNKIVLSSTQSEWVDEILTVDGGWVNFLCGEPEDIRLAAFGLLYEYSKETSKIIWHRLNGSRYDRLLDDREKNNYQLIVLDGLLAHPSKGSTLLFDPTRIGKIYDIVAKYRGSASIAVLCPNLSPQEAHDIAVVKPDYIWNIKTGSDKEY